MAMIKCPECGHNISSLAQACPECGFPLDPKWAKAEVEKVNQEIKSKESENNSDNDESIESQPRKKTPKGGNKWGWLVALVLIAVLVAGWYYFETKREEQREKRDYEMLQGCGNPAFYEDFIIKYPNSQYIEEVRARYKEVSAQNGEWEAIARTKDRAKIVNYAHLHPTSPYVSIARDMIDSIDYYAAKNLNTIEAFEKYLQDHSKGQYIDVAETTLEKLIRKKEQARRDSIARARAALADTLDAPEENEVPVVTPSNTHTTSTTVPTAPTTSTTPAKTSTPVKATTTEKDTAPTH